MGSVKSNKLFFESYVNKHIWIILVLLTLPHMNPRFLDEYTICNSLINMGRIISSFVILLWIFSIKKKVSIITILIGIQQGYILLMTIISKGTVRECSIVFLSVLSVVLLYDLAQEKRKIFLSSQMFCFELMIYINLLTEILFPNSLYTIQDELMYVLKKNWFLGFYTSHTQYFIPALMIAFLYKQEADKKIRTYVLTAAVYISALLVWSGGVLVALFGMALVYLIFKNRTKIFSYYNYWIIQILFFIFIILLKAQNLFKWLIDGILGKWNSLTGRMALWDKYLRELIPENPILGHGMVEIIERKRMADMNWACHAHNQLLEILYQGGIINLALFTAIIIFAGKSVYDSKDSVESKIIATAFLGWCLQSLVEPYMSPFLMAMFVIAYYNNNKAIKMIELSHK